MTDETDIGTRDRRGYFTPNARLDIAPMWRWPWRLPAFVAWLPHYFLPWNVLFMASGLAFWVWLMPSTETMQSLSPGWIARLWLINTVAVLIFYGAAEYRLYVQRAQEGRYKYNPVFPADRKIKAFFKGSQNLENALLTVFSGVTIWTLIQALVLSAWSNGIGNWIAFADNPIYLIALALIVPVIHQAHFYAIHRLIHTRWLYKHVHSIHHKSINPSPWSSLAMHPAEHLLYFASMLWHLVIPSHPAIAMYQLHVAGFGAIPGHTGFDRVEVGDTLIDPHAYNHYLHHRYFEVNYGDGLVPFDYWFGTYHDGSPEAEEAMKKRLQARRMPQT